MKNLLEIKDVLNTYKSKDSGIKVLSRYHNWFPLKPSKKLSGIVGDLMGDGHLQGDPRWRIDYTSKSNEELERFNQEIFTIFGIKGKIRKCTTNNYNTKNLGINNSVLSRTFSMIGVPVGSKVLKDFKIPNWILKDRELFSRFMNRLFSCEGTVDTKNRYIELQMHKSSELINEGFEFFYTIKNYLWRYYKIRTIDPFLGGLSLRKDGIITKGIKLKIRRHDSVKKFQKYIGFEDPIKKIKLQKIIESF